MIEIDGYKFFEGDMRVSVHLVVDGFSAVIFGKWLYRPDTDCWYCGSHSYPANACNIVQEYTNEAKLVKQVADYAAANDRLIEELEQVKAENEKLRDMSHWKGLYADRVKELEAELAVEKTMNAKLKTDLAESKRMFNVTMSIAKEIGVPVHLLLFAAGVELGLKDRE